METEVLDVKNFINSPIWHYDKAFKPLLNSFLDTKTWKVVGSTSHENFKEFPSSSQGGTNAIDIQSFTILCYSAYYDRIALLIEWGGGCKSVVILQALTQ